MDLKESGSKFAQGANDGAKNIVDGIKNGMSKKTFGLLLIIVGVLSIAFSIYIFTCTEKSSIWSVGIGLIELTISVLTISVGLYFNKAID